MPCCVALLEQSVLVFLGWLIAVTAPLVTHWLRVTLSGPKLSLEIDPDPVLVSTEGGQEEKLYVRVRIKNVKRRIAHACRGHLVAFEEWDDASRAFVPVFSDSVPLLWSYYAQAETFDIPQNVPLCVDVLVCKKEPPGVVLQIWAKEDPPLKPDKLEPFGKKPGTYRCKVLVSADDAQPEPIVFEVTCDATNWPPRPEDTTSSNRF